MVVENAGEMLFHFKEMSCKVQVVLEREFNEFNEFNEISENF